MPSVVDVARTNLARISKGESLWLWRRRHNLTQAQAAERYGVSCDTMNRAEYDMGGDKLLAGLDFKAIDPTMPELLRLARRRCWCAGISAHRIAEWTGRSRPTLLSAERREAPWLIDFWRKRGFRFPEK
jgi:transcriptional regulator with XRE-family HTH domain